MEQDRKGVFVVFTNRDEMITMGSDVQKIVCSRGVKIDPAYQSLFWNQMGGQNVCRHAMATKRTTVCNAIRDRFKGEPQDDDGGAGA